MVPPSHARSCMCEGRKWFPPLSFFLILPPLPSFSILHHLNFLSICALSCVSRQKTKILFSTALFALTGQINLPLSRPPDINLPLSAERSPPPQTWNLDPCDILDVGLGSQLYETESLLTIPKPGSRKCARRGDSIWGAWFFFNFYFKPVLTEKAKGKTTQNASTTGASSFEKSDLCLDTFLVQHDMENMYMWVFKERPENALGKMQLRSYMNGHSLLGEPQFPFNAEKGFVRSHRIQRK